MENPWNIQSLYELQYFLCPSCIYKNQSKQELVNHAYECHPESIEYLMNLHDHSMMDMIECIFESSLGGSRSSRTKVIKNEIIMNKEMKYQT